MGEGEKDQGKVQEEELWSLKPWWGPVRDLITASTRNTEMSKNAQAPSRR